MLKRNLIFRLVGAAFLLLAFATVPVFACSCLDSISAEELFKKESIVLYINVKDVKSQKEVRVNDFHKFEVVSTYLEYDILENISQSKIEHAYIVKRNYYILEIYSNDFCNCGIPMKGIGDTAPKFELGEQYIVFLHANDSTLSLEGSIKIVDGVSSHDFGKTEAGTSLDDLLKELRRVDTNEYTFTKRYQPYAHTIHSWYH